MTVVTVSCSGIIDAPANDIWNTLRAFEGNEKFNPLVTSSMLEGIHICNCRLQTNMLCFIRFRKERSKD